MPIISKAICNTLQKTFYCKEANKEKLKEYYKQYKRRNGKCDVCNKVLTLASVLVYANTTVLRMVQSES